MSSPKSEQGWQQRAKAKRDNVLSLIPEPWRIQIPSASEQRDVTGDYVWQYLSGREKEITEIDAEGIVKKTTSGAWSAEEVARAFAHRAALAHQLVGIVSRLPFSARLMYIGQLPARDIL